MKKFTLEELTKEVNFQIENKVFSNKDLNKIDLRYSEKLSERRIRDFTTKGLISKPIKEGRYVFYTEKHIEEIIKLREIQSKGISDNSILSITSSSKFNDENYNVFNKSLNNTSLNSSVNNESLKDEIFSTIADIKKDTTKTDNSNLRGLLLQGNNNLNLKKWEEYSMLNDNSVILKVDEFKNISEEEAQAILSNVKIFLKLKNK